MPGVSKALCRSLIDSQPLITDLPEGPVFARDSLKMPAETNSLNFHQKLGHLYEDALAILLESTPRYGLLGRGIQIRRAREATLGELDFLLRDLRSNRLIHLELAVKFYLAVETDGDVLLPGPNARDSHYKKLKKMRTHQLLLVRKFPDLLPEDYRSEEIEVQQLVHGCIFNHVNASRPAEAEFLNPNGRRGKWLHVKDCVDYFGEDPSLEIIPKTLWPVPFDLLEGIELKKWSVDQNIQRCVMVRSQLDDFPFFVTPNGYPRS